MATKPSSSRVDYEKREKIKLGVIVGVCVLCLVWITYYSFSVFGGRGPVDQLRTPGTELVNKLIKDFTEQNIFGDVGFEIVSEEPLKLKLIGFVKQQQDIQRVEEMVKQAAPNVEVENTVEIAPY